MKKKTIAEMGRCYSNTNETKNKEKRKKKNKNQPAYIYALVDMQRMCDKPKIENLIELFTM